MAESGLTLGLLDFRLAVSEFLYGGDGDYEQNTPQEQEKIDRVINDGLRQFYKPPTPGPAREWSFLNPVGSLSLNAAYATGTVQVAAGVVTLTGGTWPTWAASGLLMLNGTDYAISVRTDSTHLTLVDTTQTWPALTAYSLHEDDYPLPDDFSAFIGDLTFSPADNAWVKVQIVGESRIRERRQDRMYAGYALNQPWLAAIQPKVMDPTLGTRNTLMFWPRVVNAGTASFAYRVRPNVLTPTNLYPYGASDHSDTIKASIMSVAEFTEEQQRGVYWDEFQRLLMASVDLDARSNRAEVLGYCGDMSDEGGIQSHRHLMPSSVSYRGMVVP